MKISKFKCKYLLLTLLVYCNISFAQDLKIISPENFVAQNSSKEREAIVNFITHQFDNKYELKADQESLDKIWNNLEIRNASHMARFQIINQKLYADSFNLMNHRFWELLVYFQKIINLYKVQDIDFIIYIRDEIPSDLEEKIAGIPAFIMSKNLDSVSQKDMFLLPDTYMILEYWSKLTNKIIEANKKHPWNSKINKIFWRGATTGEANIYNINNFDKLPCLSLVMESRLYPELIDAKFTTYAQFSEDQAGKDLREILAKLLGDDAQKIKEVDHLKYKYLISIDGNSTTWGRPVWMMLSNSVLLKQETKNIQWFYSAIKPYVHYVPINNNLSNIFAQLEWIKNHDSELQAISQNAQNFVKNNLMPGDIEAHMVIILNEYYKLQKNKKINPTLPTAEEIKEKISILKSHK